MRTQSLGVVIPVYSGESFLPELASAIDDLRQELARDKAPIEFGQALLVLDEPRDESAAVARHLAESYEWLRPLTLSRNFGQHPATVAGVLHTSTDWVVTLDEDLQHPPAEIRAMLARAVLNEADLVYARSLAAVHGGWRDFTSRTAKAMVVRASGVDAASDFSSFRLIRGSIARAAASVAGHETYFDIALTWYTSRIVRHEADFHDVRGASSYRFRSLLSHLRRLLISSNVKVLRWGAAVGLVGLAIAVAALIWLFLGTVVGFRTAERGWLSTIGSVIFFGGVVSLSTGLLAEYLLNVVQRVQGRPTYHVVDRTGDRLLVDWAKTVVEP